MKLTTLAYKQGFVFVTGNTDIKEGDLITVSGNVIYQSTENISREASATLYLKVIASTPNLHSELKLPIILNNNHQQYADIELELDSNGNPVTYKHESFGDRILYKQITIKATKTYSIEVNELSNGTNTMLRQNEGFNAYELIGILTMAIHEIEQQIKGQMKPTLVEKIVVKP